MDRALLNFCNNNNIHLVAYQPIKRQEVLGSETIHKIALAHEAIPAQIALSWLLAKDAYPIPKATDKEHIDENLKAMEIKLSDLDMEVLDNI